MLWDSLIPTDYSPQALMAKFSEQIADMEDGSPEAIELYNKIQEEHKSAPVNELLDDMLVRVPGFIAPLEYQDNLITEFLLVPYFGACIHVPTPPVNQTVLVTAAEGQGIKVEGAYFPFWVMRKMSTNGTMTQLAAVGYHIQDALIERYEVPVPAAPSGGASTGGYP